MTIIVDGKTLSVTDLFKRYDLDEISDILVKIKKEIFVRTNEVKRSIGSNPDLMIDFGENVLRIYDASTQLNASAFELLRDIERFSEDLGGMVAEFVHEEFPGMASKGDLSSILSSQSECERLYFGILESFSNKNFVRGYETYLEYRRLVAEDPSVVETDALGGGSQIKQGISSSCFTFIQGCERLTSVELAQLIMIRFLLEIEDQDIADSGCVASEFKQILETTLNLRVRDTIKSLRVSGTRGGDGSKDQEGSSRELGRAFVASMTVLIDLYELRESVLLVFSEFRQRGWHHFQSIDEASAGLLHLSSSKHILRLKSVLLEEFGSLGSFGETATIQRSSGLGGVDADVSVGAEPDGRPVQETPSFRSRFLSKIYCDLFVTIRHGVGTDILKESFFPILISVIKEDLVKFLTEGSRDQLLELVLRPDDGIEPCLSGKASSIFDDREAADWLASQNKAFGTLLEEIRRAEELLDEVDSPERDSIMRDISEECFASVLDKFIEFNRTLFWSIKGKGSRQVPDIVAVKDDDDSLAGIIRFSNALIRGRQLEFLESCLLEHLSAGRGESSLSCQSLSHVYSVGTGSVSWRALLKISSEITNSLEGPSQAPQDGESTASSALGFLDELSRSYVGSSCLSEYLQKMKTLNSMIYSLLIHREDLCQRVCTYQSLLQRVCTELASNSLGGDDIITLSSSSRSAGFLDQGSVAPNVLLLELCFELGMISAQLAHQTQRSTFNTVCRSYFRSYIVPLQVQAILGFSDAYSKLDGRGGTENRGDQLKTDKELVTRSISSLYCDLVWGTEFSISDHSSGLSDRASCLASPGDLSLALEAATAILGPEELESIKNGALHLLRELGEDYNLEACGQLPHAQALFANSVQRFPTLPLVKYSSKGSISSKISIAYDKTLKANMDSSCISGKGDCNQFLLTHYSDILQSYDVASSVCSISKASSVISNQEALASARGSSNTDERTGGWFYKGEGRRDGGSSSGSNPNEYISSSLRSDSGSGAGGVNRKIETNAIWQVSNLLKETVKDKVFGQ
ncbi:hypothetical protein OJ253_1407 [Cryptosporidium canis]|uniref:Uncharacterized protein n=1 Tax=Cryptosporidium canis TaxID=195482 RepID=A0A9D5DHJ5_9CRYT|nr:hypothetical protein OJ253_1407 [Cryptosporidium canis]